MFKQNHVMDLFPYQRYTHH